MGSLVERFVQIRYEKRMRTSVQRWLKKTYLPTVFRVWIRNETGRPMCNLYAMRASASDLAERFAAEAGGVGNQPDLPAIFPDAEVPIVRQGGDGRRLVTARWGWPH